MDIQKHNQTSTSLSKLSQTTLCESLNRNDYASAAKALPSKIHEVINEPNLSDVVRVVGRGKVVTFVQIELTKLAERVNVSGNITPSQLEFISTQLVEMFPNETLADFKLCFERGCIGQYGQIYRMDGIVIREWMEKYLDEKYQVVEESLMKEKEDQYKGLSKDESGPGYELFKNYVKELNESKSKSVRHLFGDAVLSEGQSEPPKKKAISWPVSPPEKEAEIQAKIELGRKIHELSKQHPGKTLDELKAMVTL